MSNLLLDEWVWADLSGENLTSKPTSQKEALDFLEAIVNKCDRLIVVRGSAFAHKAVAFWKRAEGNTLLRRIAKFYRANFWENSNKILYINEVNLTPLPGDLSARVKPDDQYLVRACLTIEVETFVTTDRPLWELMTQRSVNCQLRDDFLGPYISRYLP